MANIINYGLFSPENTYGCIRRRINVWSQSDKKIIILRRNIYTLIIPLLPH